MKPPGKSLIIQTAGCDETRAVGRALGKSLDQAASFSLEGSLGSGKTVLTQGICEGLGVSDPVTSATFTLQNEYRGEAGRRVIHMDCFRLEGAREFEDLGVDEELDESTVLIVEWGDRAIGALPADVIRVSLEVTGPDDRRIVIQVPAGVELEALFSSEGES
jgi:tRNA threonylcarbamoyladenosine biosynthesis protein TsaE